MNLCRFQVLDFSDSSRLSLMSYTCKWLACASPAIHLDSITFRAAKRMLLSVTVGSTCSGAGL